MNSMISESVIIFGITGNVIMVLDDELPKGAAVMFRVHESRVELFANENMIYVEKGLTAHTCERLRKQNEIGIIEVTDRTNPPKHITNIAYQEVN
jgi:hypothetical protein